MTKNETSSTLPRAPKAKVDAQKSASQKLQQGLPSVAGDRGQKIDRPGFDLGGSSGETHAGMGLGLGEDAFETPGERCLPGRQLNKKLKIPRWREPESRNATETETETEMNSAETKLISAIRKS